jgi:hypothetical protein
MSPRYALFGSLAATDWAIALGDWRTPVGIIGVGPIQGRPGSGAPWLLTSVLAPAYRPALYRACKVVVDHMFVNYNTLTNHASAANADSLVLIQHLGFSLAEPEHGIVRFHKIQQPCVLSQQ